MQKSTPLAAYLGPSSIQPSQLFVSYDPMGGSGQSTGQTSQLLGTQLLHHAAVQQPTAPTGGAGMPQVQARHSSFYSQQQAATGFYGSSQPQQQQPNPGPIQQVTAQANSGATYFGAGPHSLRLGSSSLPQQQTQTTAPPTTQTTLNKSAPPFKPAAQQHHTAQQQASQVSRHL